MKLTANTFGIFAFTAIATTAFVMMATRPPIESKIMQFGMPTQKTLDEKVVETKESPALVEEVEEVEVKEAEEIKDVEEVKKTEDVETNELSDEAEKKPSP